MLVAALALGSSTSREASSLVPQQTPLQPADERPVAYMIAAEARFTKERQDLLEAIGFRPERVDPVYLEHDCEGGDNAKQKAMWGIANAHQNAWKKIVETGRRALVLESDWGIGDQKLSDLRTAMSSAAQRDEHYVAVGWCRQPRHEGREPWHFTCATAYFLGVEAAVNMTKLKHDDGEHAPCFPVDSLIVGACKDRSTRWQQWNVRLDGRCCWWSGDATNSTRREFPGYPPSQRGMFQQDRDSFTSTHSDGGSEFDEESHGRKRSRSRSALSLYAEPAHATELVSQWYRLNPPALCGEPTWGVAGTKDPAAAAGAVGKGLPPPGVMMTPAVAPARNPAPAVPISAPASGRE